MGRQHGGPSRTCTKRARILDRYVTDVQRRRRSISSESKPVYYLPYLSLYLYRETLICSVIFRHCSVYTHLGEQLQ
jgi:hypothetical protein